MSCLQQFHLFRFWLRLWHGEDAAAMTQPLLKIQQPNIYIYIYTQAPVMVNASNFLYFPSSVDRGFFIDPTWRYLLLGQPQRQKWIELDSDRFC